MLNEHVIKPGGPIQVFNTGDARAFARNRSSRGHLYVGHKWKEIF